MDGCEGQDPRLNIYSRRSWVLYYDRLYGSSRIGTRHAWYVAFIYRPGDYPRWMLWSCSPRKKTLGCQYSCLVQKVNVDLLGIKVRLVHEAANTRGINDEHRMKAVHPVSSQRLQLYARVDFQQYLGHQRWLWYASLGVVQYQGKCRELCPVSTGSLAQNLELPPGYQLSARYERYIFQAQATEQRSPHGLHAGFTLKVFSRFQHSKYYYDNSITPRPN